MDFFTLIGLAVALAMDAFAVALGAGVQLETITPRHLFRLGFHFGLFQGMMPVIGWSAGTGLRHFVSVIAPWIAFLLLVLVGGKMIYEALCDHERERKRGDPTRGMTMVMLSVATSIDALAVGFSLSMLGVAVRTPAVTIGIVTAVLTVAGMLLGRRIGTLWGSRVEILGGLVLISIGLKILLQGQG
jgi:putative Mn2+ efflux pump MntP